MNPLDKMEFNNDLKQFATKGYWKASIADIEKICNGCGPAGASLDIIPDKIFGLNIADV